MPKIINPRIMANPANWWRVGILAMIFFVAVWLIADLSGFTARGANQEG